mmetsp:Transcript_16144/g.39769  ORF Transcript_16144/g.39769 Transcript_16144/m.39769 type:complete len:1473 (-) Transcript_16144:97-4515(-)
MERRTRSRTRRRNVRRNRKGRDQPAPEEAKTQDDEDWDGVEDREDDRIGDKADSKDEDFEFSDHSESEDCEDMEVEAEAEEVAPSAIDETDDVETEEERKNREAMTKTLSVERKARKEAREKILKEMKTKTEDAEDEDAEDGDNEEDGIEDTGSGDNKDEDGDTEDDDTEDDDTEESNSETESGEDGETAEEKRNRKAVERKARKEERKKRKMEKKRKTNDRRRNNANMSALAKVFQSRRNSFLKKNLGIVRHFMKPNDIDSLEAWKPIRDTDSDSDPFVSQPSYIQGGRMKDYQLEGVRWLLKKRSQGVCPILADEMGLGKTVQSIAFLAYLRMELPEEKRGPSLVVCPLIVFDNWSKEIARWCPSLKVVPFHASSEKGRQTTAEKLHGPSDFDVCVTTYEMVKSEPKLFGPRWIRWHYVILDEGHRIKNLNTSVSKSILKIPRVGSLVLTGTPIQNKVSDLWAMFGFLCPRTFRDAELFERCFQIHGDKTSEDKALLERAHVLLHLFMLRRLKKEVVELPEKVETNIYVSLTEMQKHLYKEILLRGTALITRLEKPNSTSRKQGLKSLRSLAQALRQCCNHPYMFAEPESNDDNDTGLITSSGKMMLLDRLLVKLGSAGHRILIFSQHVATLDLVQRFLKLRKWRYLRIDGRTNRVLRAVHVREFNAPNSEYSVFMMQTKSGGLGINLQTADTVILFDSGWNPQDDLQAMARCHRIGQKKVVHVYRLITKGSVEERILHRQKQKLYMDKMLTRDSTAVAEKIKEKTGASREDLLAALKFGAQAIFQPAKEITDEDLNNIIDRSRHLEGSAEERKAEVQKSSVVHVETNVNNFDAFKQLSSLRTFEGQLYTTQGIADLAKSWKAQSKESMKQRNKLEVQRNEEVPSKQTIEPRAGSSNTPATSSEVKSTPETPASSEPQATAPSEDQKKMDTVESNDPRPQGSKIPASSSVSEEKGEGTKADGRSIRRSSRKRKRRMIIVDGIPMLHEQVQALKSTPAEPQRQRRRQKPGRDYPNSVNCGCCWQGGDIVLCDYCPASYHKNCIGYEGDPDSTNRFECSLHYCAVCGKKANEVGGALFRCTLCPLAYCDEHLKDEAKIVYKNELFEALGYIHQKQAIYVHCSRECMQYLKENEGAYKEWLNENQAERSKFNDMKQKEEAAKTEVARNKVDEIDFKAVPNPSSDEDNNSDGEWTPQSSGAEDHDDGGDDDDGTHEGRDKTNDQHINAKMRKVDWSNLSLFLTEVHVQRRNYQCPRCYQSLTWLFCFQCNKWAPWATERDGLLGGLMIWLQYYKNFVAHTRDNIVQLTKESAEVPVGMEYHQSMLIMKTHLKHLVQCILNVYKAYLYLRFRSLTDIKHSVQKLAGIQRGAKDSATQVHDFVQSLINIVKKAKTLEEERKERLAREQQELKEEKTGVVNYSRQLSELNDLGFTNAELNFRALVKSKGSVDAALQVLRQPSVHQELVNDEDDLPLG